MVSIIKFFMFLFVLALCSPTFALANEQDILAKAIPLWQANDNASLVVAVRIGSNGEVLFCNTRESSGNIHDDLAACSAISKAQPFAKPVNGLPTEYVFEMSKAMQLAQAMPQENNRRESELSIAPKPNTFPTEQTKSQNKQNTDDSQASDKNSKSANGVKEEKADAPKPVLAFDPRAQEAYKTNPIAKNKAGANYATTALNAINRHVVIPRTLKEKVSVDALLSIQSDGTVSEMSIYKSSGKKDVDDAIIAAVKKAGKLPAPERFKKVILTFNLHGMY